MLPHRKRSRNSSTRLLGVGHRREAAATAAWKQQPQLQSIEIDRIGLAELEEAARKDLVVRRVAPTQDGVISESDRAPNPGLRDPNSGRDEDEVGKRCAQDSILRVNKDGFNRTPNVNKLRYWSPVLINELHDFPPFCSPRLSAVPKRSFSSHDSRTRPTEKMKNWFSSLWVQASAAKVLQDTCSYIRSLHREVDDLSERLSELLDAEGVSSAQAAIIRSLLM
ncbi:hypothetical protein GW17_00005675 [Ensete ventricosum]|nr:hypothetical protein GW17_00005675 [Ensete ventricosum]